MTAAAAPRQGDIAFQANLYDDPNPTRRGLHRARRAWVEEAVDEFLPPAGTAIEVGIGCGLFTRFIAGRGGAVTAVDINPAFVDGVRDVAGVRAVLTDATQKMALGEHDLALCTEVLEHVPPASSLGMLRALADALRPGGVLVLTTPQAFSVVELFARLLRFPPFLALAKQLYGVADELGHINLLTARQLHAQIEQAGFMIERESRFGFYLPGIAEFGGIAGQRVLTSVGNRLSKVAGLRALLWTQAYVLRKI